MTDFNTTTHKIISDNYVLKLFSLICQVTIKEAVYIYIIILFNNNFFVWINAGNNTTNLKNTKLVILSMELACSCYSKQETIIIYIETLLMM